MQIQSISPLTGTKIKTYISTSSSEIDLICDAAAKYEAVFRGYSLSQRITLLKNLQKEILKQKDTIISTIHKEVGKPIGDCEYEVCDIVDGIDAYTQRKNEIKELEQKKLATSPIKSTDFGIIHNPIGTIGLIMPWNFPFWMPMSFIIPALLVGNPIIFKPSEYSCAVGKLIEKILKDAGYHKHVLQTIIGGPLTGERIVTAKHVKALMFVGSTEVGTAIAKSRVNLKRKDMLLEMGGNSAAIVMDDAHIENAVDAILWNGTYYAGQVCTGIKRVLVHQKIFEKFQARLIKKTKKLNNPLTIPSTIGSIINKETLNQIEYRVNQAVQKGSTLLEGGKRFSAKDLPAEFKNGNFFPITILKINDIHCTLIKKETFAPVIPLIPFNTIEEAIAIANDTDYALSINIFTEKISTIETLSSSVASGMVFINDSELAYPGGNYWKGSGLSYFSTLSDDRLLAMYQRKVLWRKSNSKIKRDYWF